MLPVRFIAESFKFNVDWEESSRTVTIEKAEAELEPTPQTPVYNANFDLEKGTVML